MTPASLFAQALTIGDVGVRAVNVPLARQAIDLHLSMGGDVMELLQPYGWHSEPAALLSLAFDGGDLDRECRLHAVWCARQVLHFALPEDRPFLEQTLEVAERYAHGRATAQELRDARATAYAAADADADADAYAAAYAAYAARAAVYIDAYAAVNAAYIADAASSADATSVEARAAQQEHLIDVVCAALQ